MVSSLSLNRYEKIIQAAHDASRPSGEWSIQPRAMIMAGNHFSVKPQLLSGLDFDRIIYCNIGNPQQLQQKPITFFRQASSPLLIVRLRLPLCVHGHAISKQSPSCRCSLWWTTPLS